MPVRKAVWKYCSLVKAATSSRTENISKADVLKVGRLATNFSKGGKEEETQQSSLSAQLHHSDASDFRFVAT